jgi:O-antigen/teichoic acid export membrane protein
MLLAIAAAPFLLYPFGVEYTKRATSLLQLLLAGCIPQTLVTVYLGMERVRGRAGRILAVQALAFVSVVTGVGLLMPAQGILGVGLAWLAAWALTAVAILPGLRSAARSPEPLRRAVQHPQP